MSDTIPIVLHIGTPKTGSTSLQEVLATSSMNLASQGYIYCKNLGETNLADIPLAAIHHDELDWDNGNLEKRGYVGEEARARFWDEVKVRLIENAHKAHDSSGFPAKVLLASSETFWFLNSSYHFERLKLLFDQCNIHVAKVHVYLRPQIELLLSSLSTMARDGWIFDLEAIGEEWFTNAMFGYLHYYKRLCSWRECFGGESIKVHLFNEHKSNLVKHFCGELGIDMPPMGNPTINKGLNLKGLNLTLSVNRVFDSIKEDLHQPSAPRMSTPDLADIHDRSFLIEAINRLFAGSISVNPSLAFLTNNYFASQNGQLIKEFMPEYPVTCLDSIC